LLLLFPIKSILDTRQEHHVVLADVFFFADGHLVTLVVKDGLKDTVRVEVLLATDCHSGKQDLELADQLHSRINQLFLESTIDTWALVLLGLGRRFILFIFHQLNLELEDTRDEIGQSVVHLEQ